MLGTDLGGTALVRASVALVIVQAGHELLELVPRLALGEHRLRKLVLGLHDCAAQSRLSLVLADTSGVGVRVDSVKCGCRRGRRPAGICHHC